MIYSALHYRNRINLLKHRSTNNRRIIQKLERYLRKAEN